MVPSPFSCILICCLTFVLFGTSVESQQGYDGYYDLSARDTAYLCSLIPDYMETGETPDIVNNPAPDSFPKSKYMKNNKCWKMRWNGCSDSDIGKTKPCGWYKMQKADASEC